MRLFHDTKKINIPRFYLILGSNMFFHELTFCQVPRKVLKTEAEGRGSQQFSRDLANVKVLENNV